MSDALVLCTESEPIGRCILEALAMDLPVIVPSLGGHLEILMDGQTALYYEGSSPASLTQALLQFFSKPDLGPRLAKNGRDLIKTLDMPTHVRAVTRV